MLAAIVLLAIAALTWPVAADAKITCEGGGKRPQGFVLHGLPAAPVAKRSYPLTVSLLRQGHGVNPSPYLGAEPCDGRAEGMPGAGDWFRPAGDGRYVLSLSFPRAGPWRVAFMDLNGTFYDLGMRRVRPAGSGLWFGALVQRLVSILAQRP
jgi:hypothetical protein